MRTGVSVSEDNGKRQMFFATANDKMASLFERKFDCLGRQSFASSFFREKVD
jgi:hypothetical protein